MNDAFLDTRTLTRIADELPAEFELAAYSALNGGLAHMDDDALSYHYAAHGKAEGRRCSRVHDRSSFVGQVPPGLEILEIGPFWAPAFRRPAHKVAYMDVYDREELQRRAATDPNSQGARVPEIDYVWRGERYPDLIKRQFDVVFSSHNIEHQPDLVAHLQDVAAILRPGGMFFAVVPDKRYCFDHFLPESTIAGVVEAHVYRRKRHSLSTLITNNTMHAHNDALEHWAGRHGVDPRFADPSQDRAKIIQGTIISSMAREEYIDAHAWQFTPPAFLGVLRDMRSLGLTELEPARVYQTVFGSFEFYAILARV